jgi:predicted component of type VI protein secretion system
VPAAKLAVREGPLAGRRFEVDREVVVGRVNADITIGDPELSRRHAVLRPAEQALEIEDLGSLNGTWVNGRRLEASSVATLTPGDLVKIGESVLEVEAAPVPEGGVTRVAPAKPMGGPPTRVAASPPPLAPSGAGSIEAPPSPFAPPSAAPRRRVATRLAAPAALSFAAIVATAAALVIYFALH